MTAVKPSTVYLKLVIGKSDSTNYSKILGKKSTHRRSTISIKEDRDALTIEITATDTTALRASVNSILRNIQVADATILGKAKTS